MGYMVFEAMEQEVVKSAEFASSSETKVLGEKDYDRLLNEAQQSRRKRKALILNENWEHATKMINAIHPDSYVKPHKHENVHQTEAFTLINGSAEVITFNDNGEVKDRIGLGENKIVDIPVNLYHTVVAYEPSVIFIVKGQPSGGYDKELDKVLASWAPEEGQKGSHEYLLSLKEGKK
jgi:cupin fold WbuC family metalloprotein